MHEAGPTYRAGCDLQSFAWGGGVTGAAQASGRLASDAFQRDRLARVFATEPGRSLARLGVLAAVLALWQFLPTRGLRFWISAPSMIGSRLWEWIIDGSLWPHLGATLLAMILGYVAGCGIGIGIGLLFGFMPRLQRALAPYLAAFYAMPKIALAPLFVIFFGTEIESKVVLVAITVFFILLNTTLDGIRNVEPELIQMLSIMGAGRREVVRKLLLPAALPWIFGGMRISVRYAFTNTLLAELIAANSGLGFLIEFYSGKFDATGTYAAILVLVIFSVLLTELLTRLETRIRTGHAGV